MQLLILSVLISLVASTEPNNNYLLPKEVKLIKPPRKSEEAAAEILHFNNEQDGDGSYKFEFKTENKIKQTQEGHLKNVDTEKEVLEVRGVFSYVDPNGQTITLNYVANENGFQASGDHLPTPPPIPEAIRKSLEFNVATESSHTGFSAQDINNLADGYKY